MQNKNKNLSGEYSKEAVDKLIKADPRIKGKEAKAIHRLLKGRTKAVRGEVI